jgi:hypothetical protein
MKQNNQKTIQKKFMIDKVLYFGKIFNLTQSIFKRLKQYNKNHHRVEKKLNKNKQNAMTR